MNLPNKITLTRIFMIPVFVVVFYLGLLSGWCFLASAGVFLPAALTDAVDGHIARSRHLVTDLGKFLDPIADKVLVSTAFIVLLTVPDAFLVEPFEGCGLIVGGVCVAVILARELIVSGFRIIAAGKHLVLAADKIGKVKTTFQDLSIGLLLASMSLLSYGLAGRIVAYTGLACFVVSTALTVVSGVHYLVRNGAVLRSGPETKQEAAGEERIAPPVGEEPPAPVPERHVYGQYVAPNYALFKDYDETAAVSAEEIEENGRSIEGTLAAYKIDAKVVKVTSGATVTRYDLEIPDSVSPKEVVKREEEIAMYLHAPDGVNVYANRADGTVSVEVPNAIPATVGMRSLLSADEYVNSKPGSLTFVIGRDVENKPVIGDIVKMKHLLVAGSTGSGRSVCLHSMLISLICKYSPEELRLILIDPRDELTAYSGLPHLMLNGIISDEEKAVTALNWAVREMERRYELFKQKTLSGTLVRGIEDYNRNLTPDEEKLSKIVIVVEELADLMSVAKNEVEERIQRLTQKSRGAGIHLVISTRCLSVDVITGVIKSNLPTRMALRVIQEVDSRIVIDEPGAQKLLGNGDMLFRTEGMLSCMRVQGAFLSPIEVARIVASVKANNEAYFDPGVANDIDNLGQIQGDGSPDDDGDEVDEQYVKALGIVVKERSASISLIQSKCSVGYNHAGKIIEWMETMGYISPFDGEAKARKVFLTKEKFEEMYGPIERYLPSSERGGEEED